MDSFGTTLIEGAFFALFGTVIVVPAGIDAIACLLGGF